MSDETNIENFEDSHKLMADWLSKVTFQLFNAEERSTEQNQRMINAAHGAAFHWGEVGSPLDVTRSEWWLSKVYAIVNRPIPAYYHAQRCLALCEAHELTAFSMAYANEALATAAALLEDKEAFNEHMDDAREWGEQIEEEEEKKMLFADLENISPPN